MRYMRWLDHLLRYIVTSLETLLHRQNHWIEVLTLLRENNRLLQVILAKETHEAQTLADIQKALGTLGVPEEKLQTILAVVRSNIAKLQQAAQTVAPKGE